jgi:hypothetical protein
MDKTPMPDHIPKVEEVGASSAPLTSAAFFIGDRCRPYNEDYMLCKAEAKGRGELDCLKEGRRVTRCAASVYVPFSRVTGGVPEEHGLMAGTWGTVLPTSTKTVFPSSDRTGSVSRTTIWGCGTAGMKRSRSMLAFSRSWSVVPKLYVPVLTHPFAETHQGYSRYT